MGSRLGRLKAMSGVGLITLVGRKTLVGRITLVSRKTLVGRMTLVVQLLHHSLCQPKLEAATATAIADSLPLSPYQGQHSKEPMAVFFISQAVLARG